MFCFHTGKYCTMQFSGGQKQVLQYDSESFEVCEVVTLIFFVGFIFYDFFIFFIVLSYIPCASDQSAFHTVKGELRVFFSRVSICAWLLMVLTKQDIVSICNLFPHEYYYLLISTYLLITVFIRPTLFSYSEQGVIRSLQDEDKVGRSNHSWALCRSVHAFGRSATGIQCNHWSCSSNAYGICKIR